LQHSEVGLKLLQLTRDKEKTYLKSVLESLRLPRAVVKQEVETLCKNGIVVARRGTIELSDWHRMELAVFLLSKGCDAKKVSRLLSWQEFEHLASRLLREHGLNTAHRVVFKTLDSNRREIDLVAWNDVFLMALDCKRWQHGWSYGSAQRAAQAQIERTTALAARLDVLTKLGVKKLEHRTMMPILLSLEDTPQKIILGVPVVPILKFSNFLNSVPPLGKGLKNIRVGAGAKQTLLT